MVSWLGLLVAWTRCSANIGRIILLPEERWANVTAAWQVSTGLPGTAKHIIANNASQIVVSVLNMNFDDTSVTDLYNMKTALDPLHVPEY